MKVRETPPPTSFMAVGAAFIVGVAAIFTVIFLGQRVLGDSYEPLIPAEKRTDGILNMPMLQPPPPLSPVASRWNLSDHHGKIVVVNYFATWCGPCIRELPELAALRQEFEPKGVVFVAVSLDRNEAAPDGKRETTLHKFVKDYAFSWPILLPDPEASIWKTNFPIPQTYLYDKQGRKARTVIGMITGQGVKTSLEELLKEP